MKKNLLFIFFSFTSVFIYSQNKHTISGYITDKRSGETIVGANIYCTELNQGVTSNVYGFYSLTLPEGTYNISFSFIGFE